MDKDSTKEASSVSTRPQSRARTVLFGVSERSVLLFQAAQRHSVRVRTFKRILPILGVAVAMVFSWFTFLAVPVSPIKIQLSSMDAEGGKLVMTDPKLDGFTKENRPYMLTAARAIQDRVGGSIIALENINADLPVKEKNRAKIDAQSGIYDSINGQLQLDKDFTVTTNDGVTANLRSADVNLKTGQITTDQPVHIKTSNTRIWADQMQSQDHGDTLIFQDKVKLILEPKTEPKDNVASIRHDG